MHTWANMYANTYKGTYAHTHRHIHYAHKHAMDSLTHPSRQTHAVSNTIHTIILHPYCTICKHTLLLKLLSGRWEWWKKQGWKTLRKQNGSSFHSTQPNGSSVSRCLPSFRAVFLGTEYWVWDQPGIKVQRGICSSHLPAPGEDTHTCTHTCTHTHTHTHTHRHIHTSKITSLLYQPRGCSSTQHRAWHWVYRPKVNRTAEIKK